MNDYSDLIMLMGSIVLFSMLSMQANRTMMMNNIASTGAEVDYHALTLGQEIIEDIRWISSESELDAYISSLPETVEFSTVSQSGNTLPFSVEIRKDNGTLPDANLDTFLITVEVLSNYMTNGDNGNPIELSFQKSFRP